MGRVKRIWYLSPMRAAKVQASLRIRAVSPEPPLLAHTSSESRGTFRQKARSLAPLNGWACAVKICHDGMLEDTNSLDAAHIQSTFITILLCDFCCKLMNEHFAALVMFCGNLWPLKIISLTGSQGNRSGGAKVENLCQKLSDHLQTKLGFLNWASSWDYGT